MGVFEHDQFDGHESVHFFSDAGSGLQAIIAVHSTRRGPSAGGVRLWSYPNSAEALRDVLRLSRGMSYKSAVADLPLGGGKAVVLKPSGAFDRVRLFEAFGRAVESLHGRYKTAEDVGVSPDDMRVIARHTRHVAGLTEGEAASGDPSPVTARGVFLGIKACVNLVFGRSSLRDIRVAIQGVGHVGSYLCGLLADAGARLIVADVHEEAARAVAQRFGAQWVEPDAIYDQDAEVFSPNALGGVIAPDTLSRLTCAIIAGGANNQLLTPDMGRKLMERGVLYAPDYVINGGGIINVAAELSGRFDPDWVEEKLQRLIATLDEVLRSARAQGLPTNEVADALARARIYGSGKPAEVAA